MNQPTDLTIVSKSLDATMDKGLWHDVADLYSEVFDFTSAAFAIAQPLSNPELPGVVGWGRLIRENAQGFVAQLEMGAHLDDQVIIEAVHNSAPHTPILEHDALGLSPDQPLPPSRMRDYIMKTFGSARRIAMKVNEFGPGIDLAFFFTPIARPELDEGELLRLSQLGPIMAQSIRMMRVFDHLRERFNAALGALDHLGIASLLVDGRGTIIHQNRRAQRLLEERDGVYRDAFGRIALSDDTAGQRMLQGCRMAFDTAHAQAINDQVVLTTRRRSGLSDYLVTISPVSDPFAELEPNFRCAMVFIIDPSDESSISVEGIRAMGQLTPAENEVVQSLVNGASTSEIAERRSVSEDTVRQQIKSILGKLNCRNRSDVVRLAMATRLPIDTL